ncbi:MAG: YeeE/YedE thiosulfate transporter family protein [Pseudomonadota bacterium]
MNGSTKFPPVLSGVLIGFSMIAAFVIAGRGIGASGFLTRLVATAQNQLLPELTEKSVYFARYFAADKHPLDSWLSYFAVGLILGSLVTSLIIGSWKVEVLRGERISSNGRLLLALCGGGFIGFAARLGRGCTSGQALVGGAELMVGAWVFMLCIFAGGYLTAYVVRKQWI